MKFQYPTEKATIKKRYKRFLSDIILENGEEVVAHVPNTGSMKTCWDENWDVLISKNDDPKRKLKYTLELTHNGESWICVNTGATNKIVKEALEQKLISEVSDYQTIKPEKKVLDSRIDFYLTAENLPDCYIEVKNVTLKGPDKLVLFPDSVSTRGQKHIKDLMQLKADGHRAIMLYIVNRQDADEFSPADEIDPEYGRLLREAAEKGVEVLAYQTTINMSEIVLTNKVKVSL